jgi:hypothetical protein
VLREENPVVEIRSRLGQMTQWENEHTEMACVLYSLILETLTLVHRKLNFEKQAWVDVEIEIDGRHAPCLNAYNFLKIRS